MSVDVVAVLDSDLNQLFQLARPIKAVVVEDSKAMEHPVEDGSTITDHRVILPVEIELSFILASEEYRDVYQQIRELFYRADLLTVQTRTGSYPNMLITKMPHEETTDLADGTTLAMTLRETIIVEAQFSDAKVRRAPDSKTVPRGEQQPKTSAQESRKGSILSGIFR